jgi:ABC-2 type transport system permease protein
MKSRIFPLMRKEFIHIIRDSRSLTLVFLWPLLMILLYGYAITFDIKEIKLGLLDYDRSHESRELVKGLISSNYFKIVANPQNRQEIEEAIMHRRMIGALIVPEGYGKNIRTKAQTALQLIVDGSNSNDATVAINYLRAFTLSYSLQLNAELFSAPVAVQPRIWYNPDLTSTDFIVPGLVAVIMMMICALLTSVTIVRERETGTMEQILVSPIRSIEIIVGKIAPYVVLALMNAALVIGFGLLVFGVPFRGSVLLLFVMIIVFVYASLSVGVFISALTKTQQVAMMASMIVTMLPSFLLSGFIYRISLLPKLLQIISYIVPAKYFLVVIRGIMLKGTGLAYLYPQPLFLLIFGTILIVFSVQKFKTRLEG